MSSTLHTPPSSPSSSTNLSPHTNLQYANSQRDWLQVREDILTWKRPRAFLFVVGVWLDNGLFIMKYYYWSNLSTNHTSFALTMTYLSLHFLIDPSYLIWHVYIYIYIYRHSRWIQGESRECRWHVFGGGGGCRYVCMCVYVCVCICIPTYIHTYTLTNTDWPLFIYYINVHVHSHTHSHTQTYIHTLQGGTLTMMPPQQLTVIYRHRGGLQHRKSGIN